MQRLSIAILGAPRVEVDGRPLSVDTRKAIALLIYLAVTGQAHSRDRLAALLWPEYDELSARASLRRTLSALKKGLGPVGDLLIAGREQVSLPMHGDEIAFDVEQFTRLVRQTATHEHTREEVCPACLQPLSDAADVYRGDFLAGFTLRECPAFEEWQRYEAESLERTLAGALERLAAAAASAGRHEQGLAAARRRLALDPLHEPAQRQVMLAYGWAGDRAAALRQYRACVRILDEELGVAPLPETTQLAELLRENRTPPPPTFAQASLGAPTQPANAPPRATATVEFPLVGRAREWDALLEAYAGAAERGCLVVLEGEQGIGKTRLAETFLGFVRARGAAALLGRCYQAESNLAYAPIADALRVALAGGDAEHRLLPVPDHWLTEAARLVPELAEIRPRLSIAMPDLANAAGARFMEGLRQVVTALLCGPVPGVLALDDLQWVDDASLQLLGSLVRRIREHPVVVLVTMRSDDEFAMHRLRQLLADATHAAAAQALTLQRLGPAEVAEMARAYATVSDGRADFASTLYQTTEGVPMLVVSYLEAVGDGTQTADAGEGSIRDLLRARFDGLSETARQVAATAATIGHSFNFETLRDASGRGEDETVAALDELLAHHLVREVDGQGGSLRFDFTHEQLRQVAYKDTSLIRRRLLHRRVAEALLRNELSRTHADPARIGMHYQLAGQDDAAAEYFHQAGERARALYANAEALAHFRTALALGYQDTAKLHEAMGDLLTLTGDYTSAAASYELAAARATHARLGALERKLGNLYARHGAWDLAESHLEAALASADETGQAGDRARVLAARSLVAHRQALHDRARAMAGQALEAATAAGDPRSLAECHNIVGLLARNRGRLDEAEHHLQRSLELATEVGDQESRVASLNNLALLVGGAGQCDRALQLLDTALGLCRLLGDRHQEAALLTNMADVLRAAGQTDAALVRLKEAVPILAEIGATSGGLQPEVWKLTEW